MSHRHSMHRLPVTSRLSRSRKVNSRVKLVRRGCRIEQLEARQVMAPLLQGIIPNIGDLLRDGDVRSESMGELTFRFQQGETIDPATVATGIRITRAGGDGVVGNGGDVVVTPGFVGVNPAPNANEVVVRFAAPLVDDVYRIDVIGAGTGALRNTLNQPFNNGADFSQQFRLDLGALVLAVVPQPITRGANNVLAQSRNTIEVYFNGDDLADNLSSAENPSFYQLIFTNTTATDQDDTVFNPTLVSYDPAANRAVLTFGQAADLAALSTGAGIYRLRIGSAYTTPPAPLVRVMNELQTGDTIDTSFNLGTLTSQTQVLTGAINPVFYPFTLPGGADEPGHISDLFEPHFLNTIPEDHTPGISTQFYNFQEILAVDGNGFPTATNVITDIQKQRAREIFEYYGHFLGVQFVETENLGITVATGDLAILGALSNPGGIAGLAGAGPTGNPLALMDNAETGVLWGNSEAGGAWFQVAMHEVGHLLGFDHANLPALTIMSAQVELGNLGGTAEPVFPGDHDLVHGLHAYRPESNDVDTYSFQVSTTGTVSAELVAERLADSSLLDAVVSIYNSQGVLIARNDDYYSKDSFVELTLTPGQYYVTVTSTGNTDFDVTAPGTGYGGTTQGSYELRMKFTAQQTTGITDTTGTLFDGDANGVPGGAYNFWFNVATTANTIYVDKLGPTVPAGTLGSITNPYRELDLALAAGVATPGKVVRVVGNAGADGNLATLNDNLAYEIGRNELGAVLTDGVNLRVPRGVTLMVDANAIFKLRRANIDVGSFSQGIDRSLAHFQVLGTPAGQVYFTSYHNEQVGLDTFPQSPELRSGDWGGIVFRNELDYDEGRQVLEDQGIFLNYVNNANITYGGGEVSVNGTSTAFSPITMKEARPTVSHSMLTLNASAALAADPNSFRDSKYRDNTFEADYDRVGPSLIGLGITGNSVNALQVDIETASGVPIDRLTTTGRFDDPVVHVISDPFVIEGTPGGPKLDELTGQYRAREDGRLVVDPGVVVKFDGGRIETSFGGQLIAEGRSTQVTLNDTQLEVVTRPVFTSKFDNRFGASGTFLTAGEDPDRPAVAGDWSGIYAGPLSSMSLDHVLVTFAGGRSPIEGTFADFNALEIHQAEVRVAHSTFEHNAGGVDAAAGNRNGRGANEEALIFVRGAQPTLVGNIFRHNVGPVVTINANALNSQSKRDPGRSTGSLDADTEVYDNVGPYINNNRVDDNDINAMRVRGTELTTQVVFDDTDIVHYVNDEIVVSNFHSYGGLRLQSRVNESLVVKLEGDEAGFTALGTADAISNRIGGTLQILGQPGRPVVLTSLADDTVGASLNVAGSTHTDTNNDGAATLPQPGDWRSVRLDRYSNDRNVAVVLEQEGLRALIDVNGTVDTPHSLGELGPSQKDTDDNRRLGFEIHGSITTRGNLGSGGDVDVYSFKAKPGTEVWLDIDRSSQALNTVIELLNGDGDVLARSDSSYNESLNPLALFFPDITGTLARVMQRNASGTPDLYTVMENDAGMRLVLPGSGTNAVEYYVRVRARGDDITLAEDGQTVGTYQLQIRLQEIDEVAGSTVAYSNIFFATNGVEIFGKPEHSPLLGESGETRGDNQTVGNAQFLGNLLQTDRQTLAVAGSIDAVLGVLDADWYRIDVEGGPIDIATVFDIDYADDLGRPDLSLYVFDENFRLVAIVGDSNVLDDRPGPQAGSGLSDLNRGTVGDSDPFLGVLNLGSSDPSFGLPEYNTYYVAVTSSLVTPAELGANPLVRLEPISSIERIVEDHFEDVLAVLLNFQTGELDVTDAGPGVKKERIFGATPIEIADHADEWHLGDVTFYVLTPSDIMVVNPFTGALEYDLTGNPTLNGTPNISYHDLAMRHDGRLFSITQGNADGNQNQNAISGNYRQFSTGDGTQLYNNDDQIITYQADPMNPLNADGTLNLVPYNAGVQFEAFDHAVINVNGNDLDVIFAVGNIPPPATLVQKTRNILYILNDTSAPGLVIDATFDTDPNDARSPTDATERGRLFSGQALVPQRATDVSIGRLPGNGTTPDNGFADPGDIVDGMRFTITDADGTPVVFEIDTGPEVALNPAGAEAVRDEMFFVLDDGVSGPTTFEFDSGPTVVLTAAMDMARLTIADDDFVNGPNIITFELDNDNTFTMGNTQVAFTAGDSLLDIVGTLIDAINMAGFNATAQASIGPGFVGRISIGSDTNMTVVGGGMALEGDYGVSIPGAVAIPFEESDLPDVFGQSVVSEVEAALGAISAGFAHRSGSTVNPPFGTTGDRLTFFGAVTADFTGTAAFTPQNDVFGNLAATGIDPLAADVAVPIDAGDTTFEVAEALATAINSASVFFNNFSATAVLSGNSVEVNDALAITVDAVAANVIDNAGNAGPGGLITGITYNRATGVTYAVSDSGGLYILNNAQGYEDLGNGPALTYVATALDLVGLPLSGLTVGPQNVENGLYADLLFATATNGNVYAFNTAGELQPIFADGATSIATGIGNMEGLAFSTLDYNLWHPSTRRSDDAGHGIYRTLDYHRSVNLPGLPYDQFARGGNSLYFGLEDLDPGNGSPLVAQPGAGDYGSNAGVYNTYNLPGGAHGSMTSEPFSLKNYVAADQPVLYFNYQYNVPNTGGDDFVNDRLKVFASLDGAEWTLLADSYVLGNLVRNGGWRQARLSLAGFAGADEVRLRFDFSTAGEMHVGVNDYTGAYLRAIAGSEIEDPGVVPSVLFDTDTFTIGFEEFEFDMGFSLVMPSSAGYAIPDGETFTVTGPAGMLTFEFDNDGTATGLPIAMSAIDSAADLALKIEQAFTLADPGGAITGVTARSFGHRVQFENSIDLTQTPAPAELAPTAIATGNATNEATNFGAFLVPVNVDMTADEVAQAIGVAVDQVFTGVRNGVFFGNNEFVLNAMNGLNLADGQQFSLSDGVTTLVFEFDDVLFPGISGTADVAVPFSNVSTAVDVAMAMANAINGAGFSPFFVAANVGTTVEITAPVVFFDPLNSPVTSNGNFDDPTIFTSVKVDESLIHVLNTRTVFSTSVPFARDLDGPFTDLDGNFGDHHAVNPGETFERFLSNTRAQNNGSEGVYIDDIIIGFAERGEMVTNATANANLTFPAGPPVITTGPYDLEIRAGQAYTATGGRAQAFDTNDRFNRSFTFTAPRGNEIHEGHSFSINDGTRVVLYEFDTDGLVTPGAQQIQVLPTDTDLQVAVKVRNAINLQKVNGQANASATTYGNQVAVVNGEAANAQSRDVNDNSLLEESINLVRSNDYLGRAVTTTLTSQFPGTYTGYGKLGDNVSREALKELVAPAGSALSDTQSFRISDGLIEVIFEFENLTLANGVTAGRTAVPFNPADTAATVAAAMVAAINAAREAEGLDLLAVLDPLQPTGQQILLLGHAATVTVTGTAVVSRERSPGENPFQSLRSIRVPSGNLIANGSTFVVSNGTQSFTFEFDDTFIAGTVLPGNVAIEYTPLDEAADIATVIAAAISTAFAVADPLITAAAAQNVVGLSGEIVLIDAGSTGLLPFGNPQATDVDMLSVVLNDNEELVVDIDTLGVGFSFVDTIVSIYDATGTLLMQVDDFPTLVNPTKIDFVTDPDDRYDPFVEFTAPVTVDGSATYFIAISGFGNDAYDPFLSESGAEGVTGEYRVTVHVGLTGAATFTSFDYQGDNNQFRDQGYTLVHSNRIMHAAEWGILVDNGQTDGNNNTPHPGVVRNLRETNTQRTVPGVLLANNVVAENGLDATGQPSGFAGGIRVSGLSPPAVITPPAAVDGQNFTITSASGLVNTFEFDLTPNGVAGTNFAVLGITAQAIANAINNSPLSFQGVAATVVGGNVEITGAANVVGLGVQPNTDPLGAVPFVRVVNNTVVGPLDISTATPTFVISTPHGSQIADTRRFQIVSGGVTTTFEFEQAGGVTNPNIAIPYNTTDGQAAIAAAMVAAINGANRPGVSAVVQGTNVVIFGATTVTGQVVVFTTQVGLFGIRVDENASPTLLNNVLAHNPVGISVDNTSLTTVIGATAYQSNGVDTQNIGIGTRALQMTAAEPLFVDAAGGNFYPAANSRIIDSSINSLEDRANMVVVSAPLGISVSNILAPERDLNGVLRVNDPDVQSPSGLGQNVFKDLGAIDRADFTGPSVKFLTPEDNVSPDINPTETQISLVGITLNEFALQFVDGVQPADSANGTGINDATVAQNQITFLRDGVVVDPNTYIFSYDANNNILRLVPLAGIWTPGLYTVQLNNAVVGGIKDLAGNPLKSNLLSGKTQFTISLNQALDFGDAPSNYPVTAAQNGARHQLNGVLFLGQSVNAESDGQPSANAAADGFDDGVQFAGLTAGATATVTVTASVAGKLDAWIDYNNDGDWVDAGEQIAANLSVVAGSNTLNPLIPAGVSGARNARFRISSAGNLAPTGPADNGEVEDYQITVQSSSPFQNPLDPCDVTGDGVVNNTDVFSIVQILRTQGPGAAAARASVAVPFPDPSGNNLVTNLDAIMVVSCVRALSMGGGGEGEGEGAAESVSLTAISPPLTTAPAFSPVAAGSIVAASFTEFVSLPSQASESEASSAQVSSEVVNLALATFESAPEASDDSFAPVFAHDDAVEAIAHDVADAWIDELAADLVFGGTASHE